MVQQPSAAVPIKIDQEAARKTLERAADLAEQGKASRAWCERIRRLSEICAKANRTHVAFIGTALLARATDPRADVHSLHVQAGTRGAYSARSVAKEVLVPMSRALGIDLGVTGREPLNNQPYFRYHQVSLQMTVKGNARAALKAVCEMLDELALVRDQSKALAALAAFVEVRRGYWAPALAYIVPETTFGMEELVEQIEAFVAANSEGGRRAQAVAAALMDVAEGPENVATARINDPDRNFPGDVATYTTADHEDDRKLTRVIEVRDKPVPDADLLSFATKAARFSVARAAVLAVSPQQPQFDATAAQREARAEGVTLEPFVGWREFVRQLFFWLRSDAIDPVKEAHERIYARLVELECSRESQENWLSLSR